MVEGPGVRVQCEKLQRFAKKRLLDVVGNIPGLAALLPQIILTICCCGKQLFFVFAEAYLRIHFGMNGSSRINATHDRKGRHLTAELHFDSDVLRFYDCTMRAVTRPFDQSLLQPQLDFCSDQYCPEASFAAARRHLQLIVSDLLLDQTICPGIGNVIKCEALFRSRVNPKILAEGVPDERLRKLLHESREFTMQWYYSKVRRNVKNVRLMYNARRCPVCGSAVQKSYVGNTHRLTFWCPKCQSDTAHHTPITGTPTANPFKRPHPSAGKPVCLSPVPLLTLSMHKNAVKLTGDTWRIRDELQKLDGKWNIALDAYLFKYSALEALVQSLEPRYSLQTSGSDILEVLRRKGLLGGSRSASSSMVTPASHSMAPAQPPSQLMSSAHVGFVSPATPPTPSRPNITYFCPSTPKTPTSLADKITDIPLTSSFGCAPLCTPPRSSLLLEHSSSSSSPITSPHILLQNDAHSIPQPIVPPSNGMAHVVTSTLERPKSLLAPRHSNTLLVSANDITIVSDDDDDDANDGENCGAGDGRSQPSVTYSTVLLGGGETVPVEHGLHADHSSTPITVPPHVGCTSSLASIEHQRGQVLQANSALLGVTTGQLITDSGMLGPDLHKGMTNDRKWTCPSCCCRAFPYCMDEGDDGVCCSICVDGITGVHH